MTLYTTFQIDELQKIEKINTTANHFSYELKTILSQLGVVASIHEYTNKKHDCLHIQLICKEKYQADKVDIAIKRLECYYDFSWNFVSDIDNTSVEYTPAGNKVFNVDIKNISFKPEYTNEIAI